MFLIIITILISNVLSNPLNCFELNNKSIELSNSNKTLIIKGEGKMCDCHYDNLLNYKQLIESIIITNTTTSVGMKCFMNFEKLTHVNLGNRTLSIGKFAFSNTKLSSLAISRSVVQIEEFAFSENEELENIEFEYLNEHNNQTLNIEKFAFHNCKKLSTFYFPNHLKYLDLDVFKGCKNLKELIAGNNHEIYKIINNVLFNINGTISIFYPFGLNSERYTIPNETKIIGEKEFLQSKLKTVQIKESVETIEKQAFYGNRNLISLFIPQSVKTIEEYSFAFNDNLKHVVIASKNIKLKSKVFYKCKNLKTVIIISEIIDISEDIFDGCEQLNEIKVSKQFGNDLLFNGIKIRKDIEKGTCGEKCIYIVEMEEKRMNIFGEGILSKFDKDFNDLIEVIIDEGIETIKENAFDQMSKLQTLEYKGFINPCDSYNAFKYSNITRTNVPIEYKSTNFSFLIPISSGECGKECTWEYNHNTKSLSIYGRTIMNYDDAESVPWYSQMSNIQIISLEKTEHIGSNAFNGAVRLTSFQNILKGVKTIGMNSFKNCSCLTNITIPSTIENIGTNAFSNIESLSKVTFEGKKNICDGNAFNNINTPLVFVSNNYLDDDFCGLKPSNKYCGNGCLWNFDKSKQQLTISGFGDMEEFDDKLIPWNDYKTNIKTISISGISSISSFVFKNCNILSSVSIGNTVISIGYNPFVNCSQLTEVIFQSKDYFKVEKGMILTKNQTTLISYLQSNTETDFIFLPDELNNINPYSFYGNIHLKLLVIPLNVKYIGEKAFSNCLNLVEVYFLGCSSPISSENIFEGSTNVNQIKVKKDCGNVYFQNKTIQTMSKSTSGSVYYFIDTSTGLFVIYGNGKMADYNDKKQPWYTIGTGFKNVIYEYGVTSIGKRALNYYPDGGYKNVKNIRIGNTVTSIGDWAFVWCSSVTSFVLPQSLINIDYGVFWGCSGMTTIYYYGISEPKYKTEKKCGSTSLCGTGSGVTCLPFYCSTSSLKTIYVPSTYSSSLTSFCGKSVTIKKEL